MSASPAVDAFKRLSLDDNQNRIFSSESSIPFDITHTFYNFQCKNSPSIGVLNDTLAKITESFFKRLLDSSKTTVILKGEHILLNMVALASLSQEIHGDLSELYTFIFQLAEHFPKGACSEALNTLYGEIPWAHTLKIDRAEPFKNRSRCCYRIAELLCKNDTTNGPLFEIKDSQNVLPYHPWFIHKNIKTKNSLHDWYALCFWTRLLFKEFSVSALAQQFVSWIPKEKREVEKVVEIGAFLSIFTTFFEHDEHVLKESKDSALFGLKKKLVGVFAKDKAEKLAPRSQSTDALFQTPSFACSRARAVSSLDTRSRSQILSTRPISVSGGSNRAGSESPSSLSVLSISKSFEATSSRSSDSLTLGSVTVSKVFCEFCIRENVSFVTWLGHKEAFSFLRESQKKLIPGKCDDHSFLTLLQACCSFCNLQENVSDSARGSTSGSASNSARRRSQNMTCSWIANADNFALELLITHIDHGSLALETILSFFYILLSTKQEEVDLNIRLAQAVVKRLENQPIQMYATDSSITVKKLFEALLLLNACIPKDSPRLREINEIRDGIFKAQWKMTTSSNFTNFTTDMQVLRDLIIDTAAVPAGKIVSRNWQNENSLRRPKQTTPLGVGDAGQRKNVPLCSISRDDFSAGIAVDTAVNDQGDLNDKIRLKLFHVCCSTLIVKDQSLRANILNALINQYETVRKKPDDFENFLVELPYKLFFGHQDLDFLVDSLTKITHHLSDTVKIDALYANAIQALFAEIKKRQVDVTSKNVFLSTIVAFYAKITTANRTTLQTLIELSTFRLTDQPDECVIVFKDGGKVSLSSSLK